MVKITKKKGFLLRDIIIAGIFATGIIALLVLSVGSMAVEYSRPDLVNEQFSTNYNKLDTLLGDLETTREAALSPSGLTFLGTFSIAFNSLLTAVNLVLATFNLFGQMSASAIASYIPLDAAGITIIMGVLLGVGLVVIIFVLLSSVTRGRV
jgi:hypothetical protein